MYQAIPPICVLHKTARSQNKKCNKNRLYYRTNETLGGQIASFKIHLLDIINIARRCHLSLKAILIKATLIILSIWILVDKTENSLFHLMTQCLHHSDLILISPAIKNLESAGRHSMPLSLIIWECSTFFYFSPQINSSLQCWGIKQGGICLRCESEGVLRLRNTVIRPPLELSEALEAPGRREKHKEISLGTILFLPGCPISMSSLRNPRSQV